LIGIGAFSGAMSPIGARALEPKRDRGLESVSLHQPRPYALAISARGIGVEQRAVAGLDWGIRGPMAPPSRPQGGIGWGMWGPVQYVKGRLAFMKAELDISDTQEQLCCLDFRDEWTV
jgi:hypothetical protein